MSQQRSRVRSESWKVQLFDARTNRCYNRFAVPIYYRRMRTRVVEWNRICEIRMWRVHRVFTRCDGEVNRFQGEEGGGDFGKSLLFPDGKCKGMSWWRAGATRTADERGRKEVTGTRAGVRLMDPHCRHFFKRFRTTFERRRASHFSKSPSLLGPPFATEKSQSIRPALMVPN